MKSVPNKLVILFFLTLMLLVGCSGKNNPVSNSSISGKYQYTGYDQENNIISEGIIEIIFDGNEINGSKVLNGGYEEGEGEITGLIDENGKINIYLNPHKVYGIVLNGNYSNKVIKGKRLVNGGPPIPFNLGSFTAKRIPF